MNTEKLAKIFVICGYAKKYSYYSDNDVATLHNRGTYASRTCDPLAGTVESRRQTCAAIEWFRTEHNDLWIKSKRLALDKRTNATWWEHPLARLEWCVDEVEL